MTKEKFEQEAQKQGLRRGDMVELFYKSEKIGTVSRRQYYVEHGQHTVTFADGFGTTFQVKYENIFGCHRI